MTNIATALREAIATIERALDRQWLYWNSGLVPRKGQRKPSADHPVALAWREAREHVAKMTGDKEADAGVLPEIGPFLELAGDIEAVREVPNFNTSRLRDKDFEKARYELHVAAMYKRGGRHVEFVPRAKGRRTADLKVIHEGAELMVECTRKDAFNPAGVDDSDVRTTLEKDLMSLQREFDVSRELIAIVAGALNANGATEILAEARRVLPTGTLGRRLNAAQSIGLEVRERSTVPLPPGSIGGVVISSDMFSASVDKRMALAEGVVTADTARQLSIKSTGTAAVYVIDSHKIASVVDSVRDKFGQIPAGACGLVYVDLDVVRIALRDLGFYLHMTRKAVEQVLATPPVVTQIAAVVLTTGLVSVPVTTPEGKAVMLTCRLSVVVRNPAGSLPVSFNVPDPWLFDDSAMGSSA
jgi:hypothetical protein